VEDFIVSTGEAYKSLRWYLYLIYKSLIFITHPYAMPICLLF
jgi:hypothetical protein